MTQVTSIEIVENQTHVLEITTSGTQGSKGIKGDAGDISAVETVDTDGLESSVSTAAGTATITMGVAADRVIPTTAQAANYDAAYGWGNHAEAGYLTDVDLIKPPAVLSPTDGSFDAASNVEITGSAYAHLYGTARALRHFEVDTDAGNFTSPIYSFSGNTDSHTLTLALSVSSDYKCRIRDETVDGVFSDWSDVVTFTVSDIFVETPSISVEGEVSDVPDSPVLTGSPFAVVNGSDTHLESDWVITLEDGTVIHSSLNDAVNLTTYQIPSSVLSPSTTYIMKVRYRGFSYGWSEYGQKTVTTTSAFVFIDQPSIVVEGEPTSVPEAPLVTTSPFSVTGGADTHFATDWEVRVKATNALVFISSADQVNLTSLQLGAILDPGVEYTFKARHIGNTYGSSLFGSKDATTLVQFGYIGVTELEVVSQQANSSGIRTATDSSGNIYSVFKSREAGDNYFYITKHNSDLDVVLAVKVLNGTSSTEPSEINAIATDSSGNVFIAGALLGGAGGQDGYIAKFDSDLTPLAQQSLGGVGTDVFDCLAIDDSDFVYAGGNSHVGGTTYKSWIVKFQNDLTKVSEKTWESGSSTTAVRSIATSGSDIYCSYYTLATPSNRIAKLDNNLNFISAVGISQPEAGPAAVRAVGTDILAAGTSTFTGQTLGYVAKLDSSLTPITQVTYGSASSIIMKDILSDGVNIYGVAQANSVGVGSFDACILKLPYDLSSVEEMTIGTTGSDVIIGSNTAALAGDRLIAAATFAEPSLTYTPAVLMQLASDFTQYLAGALPNLPNVSVTRPALGVTPVAFSYSSVTETLVSNNYSVTSQSPVWSAASFNEYKSEF